MFKWKLKNSMLEIWKIWRVLKSVWHYWAKTSISSCFSGERWALWLHGPEEYAHQVRNNVMCYMRKLWINTVLYQARPDRFPASSRWKWNTELEFESKLNLSSNNPLQDSHAGPEGRDQ